MSWKQLDESRRALPTINVILPLIVAQTVGFAVVLLGLMLGPVQFVSAAALCVAGLAVFLGHLKIEPAICFLLSVALTFMLVR